jgi:hypothetical protein
MAKISCEVTNCSHNNNGECYANCVDIVGSSAEKEGDTCCGSFLNKLTYAGLTNNTLSSGSCDCLKCTVGTCKYHDNHLCTLEHIQVRGQEVQYHTQTDCSSFKLRG